MTKEDRLLFELVVMSMTKYIYAMGLCADDGAALHQGWEEQKRELASIFSKFDRSE